MKFTIDWLKQHLDTDLNDKEIINNLTNVGLEVESFENAPSELDDFIVAKIINAQQHPNADRLKVCDVDIGKSETVKVVCGAPNAKKGLFTVYAGPGAIIPKNQMKLSISKIRGVTSYGMLCSEAELKLSDESEGITELSEKYKEKIGKKYFDTKTPKVVDLSITPNRPDCLGVRGIARDLAAAGVGSLKKIKDSKLNQNFDQDLKVTIKKEKKQGCTIFGSCLIKGVSNKESPQWLKDKIVSLGQKPISAIVDITNYVMIDLNRPLHAYDADKVSKEIIVRNSKKGETFEALDNKKYSLDDDMCVISDHSGVLGLGGIIGGTRSGTELETKNILLESAYFLPRSIRKTSKLLNIDTDAKFRFERGIDPKSIEAGLIKAADLIKEVCGGEVSKFDIQRLEEEKTNKVKFEISLFEKITGFKIEKKEIIKIISNLGFKIKENKENLDLSEKTKLNLIKKLSECSGHLGIAGGQYLDLNYEKKKVSRNKIIEMEMKKTGMLFSFCCVAPAIIKNKKNLEIRFFENIGSDIGLLFQISDDLIDHKGNSKIAGKKTGKDQKKGKATLIGLLGYNNAVKYCNSLIININKKLQKYGSNSKKIKQTLEYILNRDR